VVSSTPRPHFTTGKDPVPFYRRLGGPQGQSGREVNLVPTGIRTEMSTRNIPLGGGGGGEDSRGVGVTTLEFFHLLAIMNANN